MPELINLVDTNGRRTGSSEKLRAHERGDLHEAFSIFIFNPNGELLLQQRAHEKYHSAGLWTNTCCSHARVGEELSVAIHRRLQEEVGFDSELEEVGTFLYRADDVGGGLIEHEFDHVFVGVLADVEPKPNPEEIASLRWVSPEDILREVRDTPEKYTAWFRIIVESDLWDKILAASLENV